MANQINSQIILDGPRNAIFKVTGILDTSDMAYAVIVAPASYAFKPTGFLIDYVDYSISDQLELQLAWDATTPVPIMPLAGRGRMGFCEFGGLTNNAVTGKTGSIGLKTTGWQSGIQIFTLILELVKVGGQ